jgi:PAS domain S-box-containing protein
MPPTQLIQLILSSYRRLVGEDLVPPDCSFAAAAAWLQNDAPFCVLAHDASDDPRFIFANQAAQTCFEYSHAELIGLPSRLSAEAPNRDEREQLLSAVREHGYASGYRGLRIAKSGRRFWIENVTVWNLIDETGQRHGQAASYREWRDAE